MRRIAKALATLALLCASTQAIVVDSYEKEYTTDHTEVYAVSRNIASANGSFTYISCVRSAVPHEASCQVKIETPSGTHKQCQDVKFVEPSSREFATTEPIMLKHLGDRIVVKWYSRDKLTGYPHQYKKVSIVDMDNCSAVHLEFPIDKVDPSNHHLVVYQNGFDVYVSSKAICGEHQHCILRHNQHGERVGQPIPFHSKFAYVYTLPASYQHPEKGAYFDGVEWKSEGGIMHVVHVNQDGAEADLFTVPVKNASLMKYMRASSGHGLYTLCHLEQPESAGVNRVHCLQYNTDGGKVTESSVVMEPRHRMVGVFNLQSGGYALVYRGCAGGPGCDSVHVKTVDGEGHPVKSYRISDVEYRCESPSRELTVDHVETPSEHCFYFVCAHVEDAGKASFKYIRKCMDKKTYF